MYRILHKGDEVSMLKQHKPKNETKITIIKSAIKLFALKGYNFTTMQDVAEHAEMTKGGVYYYFRSKEEMLFSIHERFIDEGLKRLKQVEGAHTNPVDRFKALVEAHVSIMHDFKDEIQVFFESMRWLDHDKQKKVKEKRDKYEDYFVRVVQDGVANGLFKDQDYKLKALQILGSLNWMYTWYRPDYGKSPKKIADSFNKTFLDGLKC